MSISVEQPAPAAGRERSGDAGHSVLSYFEAFAPCPPWDELVAWPPDVFALVNLVLDHTEAYRFAVAPPAGRRWPPFTGWEVQVREAAAAWRWSAGGAGELEPLVARCWSTVTRRREVALASVRSGEAWDLIEALLTLHALADEACASITTAVEREAPSFERPARELLEARGSLSRLSPARVRIVPKTHFASGGITIRSLSRHLALCYESVDVCWRRVDPAARTDRRAYEIVLLPWPLSVSSSDFRPLPTTLLENMPTEHFGFFEFAPREPFDQRALGPVLDEALETGAVDAVVLPEAAVGPETIAGLERALEERGADLLVAGVRRPPTGSALGRNSLHFGVRETGGWSRYEQDKHHRWCLDESQIRQYHLTRALDPGKAWWEAIDISERTLNVVDVGGGLTAVPLVCEDLARLDEVADVVRRIGPSLVVALLLDGPQLASRWPCRYASVVADDPGSAVLTLTSLGMATRSRPPGKRRSRVVAHWNSRSDGVHEIELAPRAKAVLVSASVERATLWTADGRCHPDVPSLRLEGVRQLYGSGG